MNMNMRKLFRYLFMFMLTFLAVSSISDEKLNKYDLIILSMFATLCFLFIDLYYPVVIV